MKNEECKAPATKLIYKNAFWRMSSFLLFTNEGSLHVDPENGGSVLTSAPLLDVREDVVVDRGW